MPAKTSYHHGKLKPALISAALKELSQHGLEGVSLRSVARRAGVSAPAVYRHFEDKDALLAAVAAECAERLGKIMMEAAASAPPDDPLEAFRAVGIAWVRFAVANPEHYRALSLPGLAERAPAEQREGERQFHEAQKAGLAEAQRHGLIADLPLDDLMLTAQVAIDGLAQAIISGKLGKVDDKRAVALATAVTEVLGFGLSPRPDSAPKKR